MKEAYACLSGLKKILQPALKQTLPVMTVEVVGVAPGSLFKSRWVGCVQRGRVFNINPPPIRLLASTAQVLKRCL